MLINYVNMQHINVNMRDYYVYMHVIYNMRGNFFFIGKHNLPLSKQKTRRNTADGEHCLNLNLYPLKY